MSVRHHLRRRLCSISRTVIDPEFRRCATADILLRGAKRLTNRTYLALDYPPAANDVPRFGWGKPGHAQLMEILSRGRGQYEDLLRKLLSFEDDLMRIGAEPTAIEPGWIQRPPWMLALDGVSLYGFLRLRRPTRYIEVGSGNSTKFVARACRDGDLETTITSIDPHPRADIDALCDHIIRVPLESTDLALFHALEPNDMIFVDGSHRAFMNSDAVVFFLEVLPYLSPGVLVGIHDILLPWDYPPQWGSRYYSEQYLLASYLLAESRLITPVLPCHYVGLDPELNQILTPLWNHETMHGVDTRGFAFWFTPTATLSDAKT